jgi:hypothetical protein
MSSMFNREATSTESRYSSVDLVRGGSQSIRIVLDSPISSLPVVHFLRTKGINVTSSLLFEDDERRRVEFRGDM